MRWISLAVLGLLSGCGGKPPCVEGRALECACDSGFTGVETCRPDGSFGSCMCPAPVPACAPTDVPPTSVAVNDLAPLLARHWRVCGGTLPEFAASGLRFSSSSGAEGSWRALIERPDGQLEDEPSGVQMGVWRLLGAPPEDNQFSLALVDTSSWVVHPFFFSGAPLRMRLDVDYSVLGWPAGTGVGGIGQLTLSLWLVEDQGAGR